MSEEPRQSAGAARAEEPAASRPAPTFTPRKNGAYTSVSPELEQWMRTGWADTERRDLPAGEQAAYAAKRREDLSARFAGQRLVVPCGRLVTRSNDTEYPFRAGCDYAYLTGDTSEGGVLVMEPRPDGGHEARLYLVPRSSRENGEFWLSGHGELWTGRRMSLSESARVLALPTEDVRDLPERLRSAPRRPTRVVRGQDTAVEDVVAEVGEEDAETAAAGDAELRVALHDQRLVKDDWELGQLEFAVAATVRGFADVVRELPQAQATSERWVEGTFHRRARVEGNDVGYGTIAAAGGNATTLHWMRNDGPVRPGELLLLDAGVETATLYTADVTRTLPISGRFTPAQRRVYDLVLRAQEAGIAAVAPGRRVREYHEAAQRVLAEGLVEWGLLEGPAQRVIELGLQRRYTLHGTGHMLGLDVHDCAEARTEAYRDGVLAAGMVLTVEPGLYFQPDDLTVPEELRGIGVRIEDDVAVTAEGNRVLSAALPREPEAVEQWMAGLLPQAR